MVKVPMGPAHYRDFFRRYYHAVFCFGNVFLGINDDQPLIIGKRSGPVAQQYSAVIMTSLIFNTA